MATITPIDDSRAMPAVRGFLHEPEASNGKGLVLTHGAGGNANAPLLVAVAEAFAGAGFTVLRCDLPFRQARPHGPPYPAGAAQDREGLRRAVYLLAERLTGPVYLGGHSYGGRQASMLAASAPELVPGLLLQSYPLHPPGRPKNLRTAHFPQLTMPALFVHGARDPFGAEQEMRAALELIPGTHQLVVVEGVGHDLGGKSKSARVAAQILESAQKFWQPG